MEVFHIATLDSKVGTLRVSGVWDPLTATIKIQEIHELGVGGWTDVSFWLTEQNFETQVAAALEATKHYLLAERP